MAKNLANQIIDNTINSTANINLTLDDSGQSVYYNFDNTVNNLDIINDIKKTYVSFHDKKNISNYYSTANELVEKYKNTARNTFEYNIYSLQRLIINQNKPLSEKEKDKIKITFNLGFAKPTYSLKSTSLYKNTNGYIMYMNNIDEMSSVESIINKLNYYKNFKKTEFTFSELPTWTDFYNSGLKKDFKDLTVEDVEKIISKLKLKKADNLDSVKTIKDISELNNIISNLENQIENKLGYTLSFIPKENGSYDIAESTVRYNVNTGEPMIASVKPMFKDIFISNGQNPINIGNTNVLGKTTGGTDTVSGYDANTTFSELANIIKNRYLFNEEKKNKALELTSANIKRGYLENIETSKSRINIAFSNQNWNSYDAYRANISSAFQIQDFSLNATPNAFKHENTKIALNYKEFKSILFRDDLDSDDYNWFKKYASSLFQNGNFEENMMNSAFIFDIDRDGNLQTFSIMNKDSKHYYNYGVQKFQIGKGPEPTGFYQTFVLDEKDEYELEDLFKKRQINEVTVRTSAAVSKVNNQSYMSPYGYYSMKEIENFGGKFKDKPYNLNTSLDYYNALSSELKLTKIRDSMEIQYNPLYGVTTLLRENINDLNLEVENGKFIGGDFATFLNGIKNMWNLDTNDLTKTKNQLSLLKNRVTHLSDLIVKDTLKNFIDKEELAMFSGVNFNPETTDPRKYLKDIISNKNLSKTQVDLIKEQLSTTNQNLTLFYIANGDNFILGNRVGKQSSNAAGKINMFSTLGNPLSFLDVDSQRKEQSIDVFGGFSKIGEKPINKVFGETISSAPLLNYHKNEIIYSSNEHAYKRAGKLIANDISNINGTAIADKINNRGLDNFSSQTSSIVKIAHANTLLSYQDSDMLFDTAKVKFNMSPDKRRTITYNADKINYNKIKKLNGDFYSNKEEFISDFRLLNNKQNMFDESTIEGNIIKQLFGEDYEKIKGFQDNSFMKNLNKIKENFKERGKTIGKDDYEQTALFMSDLKKEYTSYIQDNFINLTRGKGNIGDSNIIGKQGLITKGNFVFIDNLEMDKFGNLTMDVKQIITGGAGTKMHIDSVKGTQNAFNSSLGIFSGKYLDNEIKVIIDGVANPKGGKEKRGFFGFYYSAIMNTMVNNAINTPLVDEPQNLTPAKLRDFRFKRLQDEVLNKKSIFIGTKNNEDIFISPTEFFGISYEFNRNTISVRNKFVEEAEDLFFKQLENRGQERDFFNIGFEKFVVDRFYQNTKELGIETDVRNLKMFNENMLDTLYNSHTEYIKKNISKENYGSSVVILPNINAKIKGSVINGDNVEMRTLSDIADNEYTFLLMHNLNGMSDSIVQKSEESLKIGNIFLSIVSQQNLRILENSLINKTIKENSLFSQYEYIMSDIKEKRVLNEGGISLDILRDYRTFTLDINEINKNYLLVDEGTNISEFEKGEYLFSNVLKFNNFGNEKPLIVYSSEYDIDYLGRVKDIGSSLSDESEKTFGKISNNLLDYQFNKLPREATEYFNKHFSEINLGLTDEELTLINRNLITNIENGNSNIFSPTYKRLNYLLSEKLDEEAKNVFFKINKAKETEKINLKQQYSFLMSLKNKIDNIDLNDFSNSLEGKNSGFLLHTRATILNTLRTNEKPSDLKSYKYDINQINQNEIKEIYGRNSNIVLKHLTDNNFDLKNEVHKIASDYQEKQIIAFDLRNISLTEEGSIVFNDGLINASRYARTKKEIEHINNRKKIFSEVFDENNKLKIKIDRNNLKASFKELFKGNEREAIKSFLEVKTYNEANRTSAVKNNLDFGFEKFFYENFVVDSLSHSQSINLSNDKIVINKQIQEMFDWKLYGDYDFFPNAFQFYSSYEREFELSTKHRGEAGVTSFLEKLTEVKKRVDKYIYEQLPDDIINYLYNSNNDTNSDVNNFLNEFMSEKSFRKVLNQLDGRIKSEITKLPELVDKRNQKFIDSITTSLKDGTDARFKNSLNISPSEGSSISEAFVKYFYNMDEGETNLFFDKNNVFREQDIIISEFKKIRNMNKRIYGNIIDQDQFEKIVTDAIEMKKNGSSNEEIFNFINQSKKQVSKELDDVIGISLIDEKYFKQLVKGTQFEGEKTAYGILARNPTIYQTSILYSRISSIGDKDIEDVPYLQTLFGNGELERTSDRITSFNIGRMTMQAMNGDYDGDKIYAAILSKFDIFGSKKILKLNEIEKEIRRDNILLNAIRKNIDIFEEIKKYEKKNKNGNKLLQEVFDDIIYGSKFLTSSVDEQRIHLKNTLFPIIKVYDNALSMWEDKLIDELDDARKIVHMNTYYKFYSDSLGKEVNVKNSFWYKLYKHSDTIAKNKLGNMSTEETLKTLYSIKSSDVFSKLSKVEQELVDNLIVNPEKFNEVFKEILEKDNKNLKIMFSDFGTPTYLRAYLDNIKTGRANVELTEQSKLVRELVFGDGLENQIDFITKKSNINNSPQDWWLKDFRSFYDKNGKLKQDEVDKLRTLIKVLTGDDLFGELQEKAISSKHGQDSAEALIEYHKDLIKSIGKTTVNIKELNSLKKTAASIYVARTEDDLKKINFINDYFRVFTTKNGKYSSDEFLIGNAKSSVKSLLKLMGIFSNEIFNDIDNVSTIDEFSLDRVSKWFNVKINNGVIEQRSYKKMQRYISHLNGIVIADIFKKFSSDRDGSKPFSEIFNKFKREKNVLEFLSETTSVLSEKAISAFNFVFGKKHIIKDIEVPEREIEETINDIQNSDEVEDTEDTIENIVNQEIKTDEKKIKESLKVISNKDTNNVLDNNQKNIKDIINKNINSKDFHNIDDISNNHIEHQKNHNFHTSSSIPEIENDSKHLKKAINKKEQLSKKENNISDIIDSELKNNVINVSEKEVNEQIEINTKKTKKRKNKAKNQLKLFNEYSEENEVKKAINKEIENNQNTSLVTEVTDNFENKTINETSNNNINIESFTEKEINTIENKVKNKIHNTLTEIKKNSIDNSETQNGSVSKPEIEINSKQLQKIINEKDQVIKNKNNISNIVENELKDDITNYLENENNNSFEDNVKIHKKLKNEDNKVLKQLELFDDFSEGNINSVKKNEIEEVSNNNIAIKNVVEQELQKTKYDIDNSNIENNLISKSESEINSRQLHKITNEKNNNINNDVINNKLNNSVINYSEKEINNQTDFNLDTFNSPINKKDKINKQLELLDDYSKENEVKKVIDKEVEQKQNIATTINEIKKDEIEEVLNNNIEDVSTTKQNFSVQEAVQEINEKQIEKNIEKTSIDVTQGIDLNEEIEEVEESIVDNVKLSNINKSTQEIKEKIVETVNKTSDEVIETKKIDAVGEVADKMKNTATKFQKKMKSFSEKHKTGVVAGGALITLGLFFNLINRNRTVVHLEMNDQINQQEQGLNSRNNIQRRMGQYQINTNIRDTF